MNIVAWSGGKDSTATILLAHIHGIPIDLIVFCEVMYCNRRNISGENPDHIAFIYRAKKLFESWGYNVMILRNEEDDYLSCFHKVVTNPRKYPENQGKMRGFPLGSGMCSIKRDLKLKPMLKLFASMGKWVEITQLVGIAYDEPERLAAMHKDKTKVSLMELFKVTEQGAIDLCNAYDLVSPTYELSSRGGCWFCPYAKMMEHRRLMEEEPDLWEEFVSLEDEENLAADRWNVYRTSLRERTALLQEL